MPAGWRPSSAASRHLLPARGEKDLDFDVPRHSSHSGPRRRVITIHDLTYKRFPELLQKETLADLDRHMQREIAIADAVICVSESTRSDVLRYYEADPRRIVAIRSGLTVPEATEHVDLP